jgi:hypothetical protein
MCKTSCTNKKNIVIHICICIYIYIYRHFKSILLPRYYKHLKLLAYAMNSAESSVLCDDTIRTIEFLLNEFDRLFPILYPVSILFFLHTRY